MATKAKSEKPNILVIFGDDIGMWNLGAYTHGMMGKTPSFSKSQLSRAHARLRTWLGEEMIP